MGKQRPDQPGPAAPATPSPFAALASLRGTLPEGTDDEPAAASAGDNPFAAKLVIARERKGRGGKTATLVRGVALTGAALETFAREMRQSLGTGGGVEGDAIVLAGDQSARAAQWLRERGATRIVIGNWIVAHITGYALFDTAIGRCAIAWGERGITRCALPATDEEALRRHIAPGSAQAGEQPAPPAIAAAITRIVALLAGARDDLRDLVLDLDDIPEFHRRVFAIARAIAPGDTITYGELARRLGTPGAARAVGQALGANPFPIIVPCHRIVAANGRLGGFSAPGGARTKLRMLQIEGATSQLPRLSPSPLRNRR